MKSKMLNINDIVKVNNTNLIVIEHFQNTYIGQDIKGNKVSFFVDEIEKIIIDSTLQMTVNEAIKIDKSKVLQDSLIDVNNNLKSPMTSLSNIKTLKQLRTKIKDQIKELEPLEVYIQKQLF